MSCDGVSRCSAGVATHRTGSFCAIVCETRISYFVRRAGVPILLLAECEFPILHHSILQRQALFMGHTLTHELGQEVLNSRRSSRVGSGRLTGRVGAGQEVFKYHGTGQAGSGRVTRPDPRAVNRSVKNRRK